jgi:hypothetical protein
MFSNLLNLMPSYIQMKGLRRNEDAINIAAGTDPTLLQ